MVLMCLQVRCSGPSHPPTCSRVTPRRQPRTVCALCPPCPWQPDTLLRPSARPHFTVTGFFGFPCYCSLERSRTCVLVESAWCCSCLFGEFTIVFVLNSMLNILYIHLSFRNNNQIRSNLFINHI